MGVPNKRYKFTFPTIGNNSVTLALIDGYRNRFGSVTIVTYPVAGVVVVLDSYATVALLESLVLEMVGLLVVMRI